MTRHARNCTAGAVYTYSEKKRDAAEAGYGTNAQRLGKDSVKSFDCCSLTLQPCRTPVVTKDGVLFDKEAILKYMITKKNEYSRKLKEYERSKALHKSNETVQKTNSYTMFTEMPTSSRAISCAKSSLLSVKKESSISNVGNGNEHKLPSFWVPSECPNAGLAEVKKPDSIIYCPVTQKPIKIKDFIDVKFTKLPDDANEKRTSLIAKEARYMCPITHDVLSNAVPCFVLRPTGDVVTGECVEKLIRKDMIHPLTNKKLSEKDIIPLQRGGTGYAITNEHLEAKEKRPMLQV